MPRSRVGVAYGFSLLLAAGLAWPACADKIPITTSSPEAKAAFLEGRDLFEKLRVPEARSRFEQAVALDPDFGLALLNLANSQPTARGFNEVLARAGAVADRVSPGEQLMIRAGQAAGHGDNAEQIRLLAQLTALHPDDERARNAHGNALFATQDWKGAIREFEEAVRINPEFSQPYNQLGYSYRFLGQFDRAEAAFKQYIALIPDNPNPYDSYAELMLKLGRYDESITYYRKALGADPKFSNSHLGIATDYDLLREPAKAKAEIDALLAQAQDDGQRRAAMFAQTVSYAHAGDHAAAQQEMQKQYELGAATGDTLAMVGDLVAMGSIAIERADARGAAERFQQAGDLVERAVTLPAGNRANLRRFQLFLSGRAALARGDVAGAGRWSERFAAEANASGSAGQKLLVHELAGQVALARKQWVQAIAELAQSNLQDPYNLYRLSLAHAGAGNPAKAHEYSDRARNDNTLTSLNYAFVRRALLAGREGPGSARASTGW